MSDGYDKRLQQLKNFFLFLILLGATGIPTTTTRLDSKRHFKAESKKIAVQLTPKPDAGPEPQRQKESKKQAPKLSIHKAMPKKILAMLPKQPTWLVTLEEPELLEDSEEKEESAGDIAPISSLSPPTLSPSLTAPQTALPETLPGPEPAIAGSSPGLGFILPSIIGITSIIALANSGNGGGTGSENPPVPEPATMTVLGIGVFSLIRHQKSRRKVN